jgi:glycosyltransferase involved in cell wall biosynthesis
MRIAIEAQRLFREKKHGMDVVALELIKNLQQLDSQNEYFIIVKPGPDRCISETANFTIVELEGGAYPIWEQIALPRTVKRLRCELLHCTSNTAPEYPGVPLVLTLHDIIYLEGNLLSLLKGKGTAYQRFGNIYRRRNVPIVVRKSARVITVSEFEKQRIAAFFNLDSTRLKAVYNGVGEHFKPVTDKVEIHRLQVQYQLPDRYIFFLGNTVQKKNTPGTLLAYSIFRDRTGLDIPLVMLDFDRQDLLNILTEIGKPEILQHIHLTGYVNNSELPGIYSLADLFLYPSFRESFGIPILEAQACGTAVITSNTSSMPEIAGNGAIIIDPYNPEQIAEAMMLIFENQDARKDLLLKGYENAKRFSWRAMAENVLSMYMEMGQQQK